MPQSAMNQWEVKFRNFQHSTNMGAGRDSDEWVTNGDVPDVLYNYLELNLHACFKYAKFDRMKICQNRLLL